MTRQRRGADLSSEKGVALVYLAVTLSALLLFAGLATDSGRAYVVKSQLSKAVDAAALGAARNLGGGDPQGQATKIFHANFPAGYMGTTGTDPTTAPGFFAMTTDNVAAKTIITITATADVPTTFMKLGNFQSVTVGALGQATRRMVDLSLVLDVSSSIGSQWGDVRDAARSFIGSFDQLHDRLSLLTFSNGAAVLDQMPTGRGFDKPKLIADVPQNLPGGSTNTVEGIYRAWDELRTVSNNTQSTLRIIVLFTDGASNSVDGDFGSGIQALRTYDFPKNFPDPDTQTWNNPLIVGLFDPQSGVLDPNHNYSLQVSGIHGHEDTTTLASVPWLPAMTSHQNHRSSGIPTSFPLQTAALTVNHAAQNSARPLRNFNIPAGKFPAELFNINNAARNVLEIIADKARSDAGGAYPVRIYTIGMSFLVRYMLGTMPEKPEDILVRIANDKKEPDGTDAPDYNSAQLAGNYYHAATAGNVGTAFQNIYNQIIRLTK
jgi:Flp pilus assembly protein TadG